MEIKVCKKYKPPVHEMGHILATTIIGGIVEKARLNQKFGAGQVISTHKNFAVINATNDPRNYSYLKNIYKNIFKKENKIKAYYSINLLNIAGIITEYYYGFDELIDIGSYDDMRKIKFNLDDLPYTKNKKQMIAFGKKINRTIFKNLRLNKKEKMILEKVINKYKELNNIDYLVIQNYHVLYQTIKLFLLILRKIKDNFTKEINLVKDKTYLKKNTINYLQQNLKIYMYNTGIDTAIIKDMTLCDL